MAVVRHRIAQQRCSSRFVDVQHQPRHHRRRDATQVESAAGALPHRIIGGAHQFENVDSAPLSMGLWTECRGKVVSSDWTHLRCAGVPERAVNFVIRNPRASDILGGTKLT